MSTIARNRGRRSSKKGVALTIMVCGKSGTGRTTFINTLCGIAVLPHEPVVDPGEAHREHAMRITSHHAELEEEGVRISLTVIDTPGFGDKLDNGDSFQAVSSYLERQFDEVLAMETRVKRNPRFKDDRVHALLYFIEPTGHALREMDILIMRQLGSRVNVIPVIGRADSCTPSELRDFKRRIMEDIEHHQIAVWDFPDDVEDDAATIADNAELRASLPFALVGSEDEMIIQGKLVRVRRYPWGVVEVDNPAYSDFGMLRSALLDTHLTELKETTHDYLYENYRTERLSSINGHEDSGAVLPAEEMATQAARIAEDRLRREEEKLREIELRVQREIAEKRQELLAREETLRTLESRLHSSHSSAGH